MEQLIGWKQSTYRKPLLMQGIRQVGKTWLLKEFGRTNYTNTVYCNFDETPDLKQLFQTTKNPKRLLDMAKKFFCLILNYLDKVAQIVYNRFVRRLTHNTIDQGSIS